MLNRERIVPTDVGTIQKMRRTHTGSGGNGKEPLYHTDGLLTIRGIFGAGEFLVAIRSQTITDVRRNTKR